MANGRVSWLELHAKDAGALAGFYENVFGWKIQRDENMPDYVMFTEAGGDLGGGFTSGVPEAGGQIYLESDDIAATLAAVGRAGGKTLKEKTLINEQIGWWGQFSDPAGNVMGLFQQPKR